jgi:hypothetical protein
MLHPNTVHRVVLAAAFLLYVVFALRTGFTVGGETYYALADDASISMRYAKHLAEGHGIVWNVGDPPLEGYTNFSWMVVMAGVHLLPLATAKMALPVMLLGVLTLVGVLLMMRALMRRSRPTASP